jgi:hypothetical protein
MAWVVNNSARVIHVGGVILTPGLPAEVHDDALKNEQVENMFKEHVPGSDQTILKKVDAPPAQPSHPQHAQGEQQQPKK